MHHVAEPEAEEEEEPAEEGGREESTTSSKSIQRVIKKHPADTSAPIQLIQHCHPSIPLSPGSITAKVEILAEGRVNQLTPTEGSIRSDEGYHSNYHDDALTPPEDSSDSDNDNYVLDCSLKPSSSAPKSGSRKSNDPEEKVAHAQDNRTNEFRKVKIKMPKAYHYQRHSEEREIPARRASPECSSAVIKVPAAPAAVSPAPPSPRYIRQYSPEPMDYEDHPAATEPFQQREDAAQRLLHPPATSTSERPAPWGNGSAFRNYEVNRSSPSNSSPPAASAPAPSLVNNGSILESILLRRQGNASAVVEKESGAELLRREYYREVSYRESFKDSVQVNQQFDLIHSNFIAFKFKSKWKKIKKKFKS